MFSNILRRNSEFSLPRSSLCLNFCWLWCPQKASAFSPGWFMCLYRRRSGLRFQCLLPSQGNRTGWTIGQWTEGDTGVEWNGFFCIASEKKSPVLLQIIWAIHPISCLLMISSYPSKRKFFPRRLHFSLAILYIDWQRTMTCSDCFSSYLLFWSQCSKDYVGGRAVSNWHISLFWEVDFWLKILIVDRYLNNSQYNTYKAFVKWRHCSLCFICIYSM